jgi:hypothetical protein
MIQSNILSGMYRLQDSCRQIEFAAQMLENKTGVFDAGHLKG